MLLTRPARRADIDLALPSRTRIRKDSDDSAKLSRAVHFPRQPSRTVPQHRAPRLPLLSLTRLLLLSLTRQRRTRAAGGPRSRRRLALAAPASPAPPAARLRPHLRCHHTRVGVIVCVRLRACMCSIGDEFAHVRRRGRRGGRKHASRLEGHAWGGGSEHRMTSSTRGRKPTRTQGQGLRHLPSESTIRKTAAAAAAKACGLLRSPYLRQHSLVRQDARARLPLSENGIGGGRRLGGDGGGGRGVRAVLKHRCGLRKNAPIPS